MQAVSVAAKGGCGRAVHRVRRDRRDPGCVHRRTTAIRAAFPGRLRSLVSGLSSCPFADPAADWQRPSKETLDLIWQSFRESEATASICQTIES